MKSRPTDGNNIFRWYRSSLGRYTQPDPIGFLAADINLYQYVRGNPLSATDPRGLITLKRTEIKHPLGWSPNGGGLTIARGLKVVWTCEKDGLTCPQKWKLNFVATEVYEMWAVDASTMEHEDIHVDIDWSNNLATLSRLLPAEHQRYSSATECNLAGLAALANAAQYVSPDPRQFWHDLKDFFTRW